MSDNKKTKKNGTCQAKERHGRLQQQHLTVLLWHERMLLVKHDSFITSNYCLIQQDLGRKVKI